MAVVAAVHVMRINRERAHRQQLQMQEQVQKNIDARQSCRLDAQTLLASAGGSKEATKNTSWYDEQALGEGQVIALHGRKCGQNGMFSRGEIGEATQQENGNVVIIWPNGSMSQTTWPNLAWYRGRPRLSTDVVSELSDLFSRVVSEEPSTSAGGSTAEPDDDDDSDAQCMFAVESEPGCGVPPASWQERRMLEIGNSDGCAGESGAQAVGLDVRDQISGWGDWAEALFKPKKW
mmetsp:Transcript_15725/g.43972  ORF Transcript_15725/g.43972 Transcript_15725/m.43972 type:complete len:234 (+) Transcript_15725:90-791(+)